MALTVTLDDRRATRLGKGSSFGLLTGTIGFDSSYPTGGEALTGVSRYFRSMKDIHFTSATGGYKFEYDRAGNKVLAFLSAGFTPAGTIAAHTHVLHFQTSAAANAVTAAANQLRTPAAAFDVAGVVDSAGEGGVVNATTTFTGTAVAAAVLVEVANATNLSALTAVRFTAVGIL